MNKLICQSLVRKASTEAGIRQLHKSQAVLYQISSEHLREGGPEGMVNALPKTVAGNVKNVVGWRGGAERGFLAVYSDCIHVIRTEGAKFMNADLTSKYMKVFTHNLSSDVLGQRYGILVPIIYRQLQPKATKDQMLLTHALGWSVELIRAASIVSDRVSQRPALVPKGLAGNQGAESVNEALALETGALTLLKHYFRQTDPEKYLCLLDAVLEAQQHALMGRNLHLNLGSLNGGGRLAGYDMQTYKQMVRSSISQTNFCLPFTMALHMANFSDPQIHSGAHSILIEIGTFLHVTRDYVNCYVDADGTDIADGRMSWLIILAKQRANSAQLAALEACYGKPEPECVAEVKKIYQDLNLKKISTTHINVSREDIHKQIHQISKLEQIGLSQDFFFKLIENMIKG